MDVLRNKKKATGVVGLFIIAVLLSVLLIPASLVVMAEEPVSEEKQIQEEREAGAVTMYPPTPIPGEIIEGDYLRIGINPGGTLGVGSTDPGVGFQWAGLPPNNFTESLAIWWWGEGYKIAYKEKHFHTWVDTVAYYQPGYGWPPPAGTNIVPVSEKLIRNDDNAAIKQVKVRTADGKLLLTFTFTLLKEYPELNLETTIQNLSYEPIRDVVYTRIADWDVGTITANMWASTDHAAYAWGKCKDLNNAVVQLTIAGHDGKAADIDGFSMMSWMQEPCAPAQMPIVSYVDLLAWDDMTVRKPNEVVQSFVPKMMMDYAAGIYYKIGDLMPKSKATVYTVYQANFPLPDD